MLRHEEFADQPAEELLELIWVRRESGDDSLAGVLGAADGNGAETLVGTLQEQSLLRVSDGRVALTESGETRARSLVRRHRLAERLLADVLNVPLTESEQAACLLEHALSPTVTDAVCTLLAHPPTCPHDQPIPPGPCCARGDDQAAPVVVALDRVEPGSTCRVVYMTPDGRRRLDKLESLGLVPGTSVRLVQKRPSLVLEVGGTSLAIERELGSTIFVRRGD